MKEQSLDNGYITTIWLMKRVQDEVTLGNLADVECAAALGPAFW
jgi:hypothetical protein